MARGGNEAGFAKIRTTLAVIYIASPYGLEQCAFIANERGPGGFNLNSHRHCRGPFLLAGFVKGVIGLGLPTVSIGLLGLVMTPAQAAAILVVPSLVTNVWQAVVGGGLFALARRLWPMLTGICIGTVVGVMLLPHRGRATVWLGLALVIYAAFGLMKGHFVVPSRMETWLGLLMARLQVQ